MVSNIYPSLSQSSLDSSLSNVQNPSLATASSLQNPSLTPAKLGGEGSLKNRTVIDITDTVESESHKTYADAKGVACGYYNPHAALEMSLWTRINIFILPILVWPVVSFDQSYWVECTRNIKAEGYAKIEKYLENEGRKRFKDQWKFDPYSSKPLVLTLNEEHLKVISEIFEK